jgi:hypothetical protein
MAKKYLMKCILPTPTLTKDLFYEVISYPADSDKMIVVNDFGNKISIDKRRFKDLIEEDMKEQPTVTCIDQGKFRNLTKGKTYKVKSFDGKLYTLTNDKGIISKYGKKYFKKKEAPAKPAKPKGWLCVIPSETLLYHKRYDIKKVDGDHVFVKDEEGKEIRVLAKRFKK